MFLLIYSVSHIFIPSKSFILFISPMYVAIGTLQIPHSGIVNNLIHSFTHFRAQIQKITAATQAKKQIRV